MLEALRRRAEEPIQMNSIDDRATDLPGDQWCPPNQPRQDSPAEIIRDQVAGVLEGIDDLQRRPFEHRYPLTGGRQDTFQERLD